MKDMNASFSIKRAVLAVDTATPIYGREYSFQLPTDCLKLLNVGSPMDVQDYQIEGKKILYSSNSPLYIRYISNAVNISDMDADFQKLLALSLAFNISTKATQELKRLKTLYEMLSKQYLDTSSKYGQDNKIKRVSRSAYMDSKYDLNEYNDAYNGYYLR